MNQVLLEQFQQETATAFLILQCLDVDRPAPDVGQRLAEGGKIDLSSTVLFEED